MVGSNRFVQGAMRLFRQVTTDALAQATRTNNQQKKQRSKQKKTTAQAQPRHTTTLSIYPGDYTDHPNISYQPRLDREPDPGEVVWTWVPYEEDHSQGKDRPVLLIGRDGPWLLGLQVTSQDHDRDAEQEAREGRFWFDIGSGDWDERHRPSEVRVNRIIRIDPNEVRRIGAILNQGTFNAVANEVGRYY